MDRYVPFFMAAEPQISSSNCSFVSSTRVVSVCGQQTRFVLGSESFLHACEQIGQLASSKGGTLGVGT